MKARRSCMVAAAIIAASVSSGFADPLTLERIFAAPDLSGASPREVKIAPDGGRVTFLQGKASNKDQLDLWEYNVKDGAVRRLVDSDRLLGAPVELSDEEKARRERKRIAGTTGIVEYDWSHDGSALLFPLGGDVYVYRLGGSGKTVVRRITETEPFETDTRFSPEGHLVSYIRDQDLFGFDLRNGEERQITTDGEGVIRNGMAEFVAQEEMGRFTGYWWSPDERRIAFARVDESPVGITKRFEIYAESVEVFEQRYPHAGTNNAQVELFVVDLVTGRRIGIDAGIGNTSYLYRVAWFPDGRYLAVQRQPRDLQSLDLLKCDTRTGKCSRLLRETSDTWIEPQDNLTFLKQSEELIWSSRRSGYEHLYLYDWNGRLIRQLTKGAWEVTGASRGKGVLGVDEAGRRVFFMATRKSPLERHFYAQSLDTGDPERVTRITQDAGVHDVDLSESATLYVDSYSDPEQPTRVSIHAIGGERLAWLEENAIRKGHPYEPFAADHIVPEFGTLEAADGQDLYYRLYKPAGFDPSQKYPVLIYVYGGPRGQSIRRQWGRSTDLWLQLMARRGYAVFTVDNRGTGFRGAAFDAPIYGRLGHVEVQDQLTGVAFLEGLEWVDADRIGLFGWSYGGYMTLMMLLQAPERFAAGVSGAPVTDWRLYDTYYTERFLGHPDRNATGYEKSSVFPYVENLNSELLVIHGMADDNVLFTNSTKLFKALQDTGKQFEMMTYPGAKHSLVRIDGTGVHSLRAAMRFLDRALRRPSRR